ncbi:MULTISPECIES: DeoR/GlpR family DNA-binding transcription regulator [Enterococcus]|uniref:DeoR/GlpR family DNA-binding transcription regulator n=1 Tax=Enterococcus TaxID=1350 RepID=UPI000F517495|nr:MULTISPECIES: DeoR/GlpR family DNA-binding transcription regulator [Enterococcus]MEB5950854.1 DeoR/GlpR family DNA-binding transcription regulator [Enterococcus innesii]MEB6086450.1 DeoR/GlpR family DNA-binding transcription regulator [Enterococcus casseliflavus]MEB6146197.1 DeoR/GlpR family DNA-binding transcription regulator [Enterococcus casseliflavus]MUN73627.1 DeoR family transcriptional regulator [Enterococcus casseliflavus]MUN96897.1 DeoR family transcriptional regulator [Enterococcu
MLIEQRLDAIKNIIEEHKSASIEFLAENLNVSKDTIRRDLIKLEEQNVVRRTHGGAVSANREATIFDYEQRSSKYNQIKEKIAQEARKLIKDNCSIIFDSSTTVEVTIPQLHDKTFYGITNSLTHAMLLAKCDKTTISVLPGKLHKKQLFLYGTETVSKLEKYKVDYTLLGVFALSADGLFIHTEEEGLVKRQMVRQAKTVIALTDHTKLDTTGFFKICNLSDIDILVTDRLPNEELRKSLEENKVKCIMTDE